METMAALRDAVPAPVAAGSLLCWGIWFMAEILSQILERGGWKELWWGPVLTKAAPVLLGVGLCATPGILDTVREDWLGLSHLPLTVGRAVSYGVTAGAFAMVAHAWGLRAAMERILRKKVTSVVEQLEAKAGEPPKGV